MRHGLRIFLLVAVAGAFVAAGCATAGNGERGEREDRNRISQETIEDSSAPDVLDLVRSHRPAWLRGRGAQSGSLQVYLDNQHAGGESVLQGLSLRGIQSLEYLTASEAGQRFGPGSGGPAIIVHYRDG